MPAAKKAPAKRVAKKAIKDDGIYWVILERKFLTWKAHSLYKTKERADEVRKNLEFLDTASFSRYKVERTALAD